MRLIAQERPNVRIFGDDGLRRSLDDLRQSAAREESRILPHINNPERRRSRAEEARVLAEQMVEPDAIATMRNIVQQYEDLAEKAERRRTAKNSS
jgi:hypothetical protein